MRGLRALFLRLVGLADKRRPESRLSDELRSHVEMHVDDNVREGMTPEEARRQALLALGGVDQTKEQYRDRLAVPLLETVIQDVRYAFRTLRKSPTFTAAAIVTLALGIGVNTAMFSFADATSLRPPDVPRAGELVRVFSSYPETPYRQVAYPDYLDFKAQSATLAGLAAYDTTVVSLTQQNGEAPMLVGAWVVSTNIFTVLEVQPVLGRGFRDDEGVPGARAVVVISHTFWERVFGSDPNVVGRQVRLATRDVTIVGVMPERFTGTDLFFHPDLYIPIAAWHDIDSGVPADVMESRRALMFTVLGRLKPGVGAQAAHSEIVTLARAIEAGSLDTNRGRSAILLPEMTARNRLDALGYAFTWISLGLVSLVLLIACANVANLMLSRASGRTREIAVRLALGASRGRVIRQLLTESVLLASAGGALGLVVAYGGIRYFSMMLAAAFATSDLPIYMDARIDTRVLVYTLGAAMAAGVLFGLTPAFHTSRKDLTRALKPAAADGAARGRWFNFRNVLVGTQVALSVVLLSVAGLSVEGYVAKAQRSPGFHTDRVLLMSLDSSIARYSPEQSRQFYERLVDRAKELPGVAAAGMAQSIPLSATSGSVPTGVVIDGYQMPPGQQRLIVNSNVVDPGFWKVLRMRIVAGRTFDERDTPSSPRVAIVNETMARRFWPNRSAIGQKVSVPDRNETLEIVGIAEDSKYVFIGEVTPPYMYTSLAQKDPAVPPTGRTLVVLANGDPAPLATLLRVEVQALGPGVPVYDVRTFDNLFQARGLLQPRLFSQTMSALGLLGMALAVVGLYGVVAYLTAFRTREIGIRMAIGADRRSVFLLVLRQAAGMVGAGVAIGIGLALVLTPALPGPFGLKPRDGLVMTVVPLALVAAACLASLIPATRATRVSPMTALREE